MSRPFFTQKVITAVIVVFLMFILSVFFSPTYAMTDIGGRTITSDTTWTSEGSPYVASYIVINAGVTLTIDAGVVIKFRQGGHINVQGKLIVNGTASNPVYFTSIKDDSVGGDTDGVPEAAGNDWQAISVNANGEFICNYAYIRHGENSAYGGQGIVIIYKGGKALIKDTVIHSRSANIYNEGDIFVERSNFNEGYYGVYSSGKASIKDSRFDNNYIYLTGEGAIEGCSIQGREYGVRCPGGTVSIIDNEISSNVTNGVGISGYGKLTIKNNRINGNCYPIVFTDMGKTMLTDITGNIYSTNTYDGFGISGNISSTVLSPMEKPYVILGLVVPHGQELEVDAGTIFKIQQGWSINVQGKLVVNGTASNPVYFTSIKDDSVGGDTDGVPETPGNDWRAINVNANGEFVCNYAYIRHGENSAYGGQGIVIIYKGGKALIKDTVIHSRSANIYNEGDIFVERSNFNEGYYGVYSSGKASIKDSRFDNNYIYLTGEGAIEGCSIQGREYGVRCPGGTVSIIDNEISSNVTNGVGISGYGKLTIKNNRINGNCYPIVFTDMGKTMLTDITGNIYSTNTYDGFGISGNISSTVLSPMEKPYVIISLIVPHGQELEVAAGTIFKIRGNISVQGKLIVNGTASKPVYFTSIKDDSVGGDTDGIPGTPGADWGSIIVNANGEFICNYAYIRHGENNVYGGQGIVRIYKDGKASIKDTNIQSRLYNIRNEGELIAERVDFRGATLGVYNTGNAIVKDSLFVGLNSGIQNGNLQMRIAGCRFEQCQTGVNVSGGQVEIISSTFRTNSYGILYSSSSILPYIRNNNFIGNQIAVKNSSQTSINCTWNYWGHTEGPSTYQATTKTWTNLGDRIDGSILYNPWFTTERSGEIQPVRILVTGITEGQKINQDPTINVSVLDGTLKSVSMDAEPWVNGQALSDGTHIFRVVAENFKQEEREMVIHFSLDRTPPIAVIDNGDIIRGSVAGGAINLTALGSTDNSVIAKYSWSFSDGLNYIGPSITRKFTEAGEYTVVLTVMDDHGNISEPIEALIIIEDAVLITIEGVQDGQKATADLQVNIRIEGGELNEIKLNQSIISETSFIVSNEGNHTLTVSAESSTGAISMKTIRFSLDKTPPVARLGSDRTVYINEEVVISGGLSYDNLGVAEYKWLVSGDSSHYQGMYLRKTFATLGEYQISLRVCDTHGLWSDLTATMVLNVVHRPVEVVFQGITNGQKFNQPVAVNASINHGTIKSFKLNGNNFANGSIVNGDGSYIVEVIASNENEEEKTFSVQFSIDQTPPEVSIDRSIPISAFDDNKLITFYSGQCFDNTGIVCYEWRFSDSTEIYSGISVVRGFTQIGNYTVTLVAVDGYGNRSNPDTMEFIVKEKGNIQIEFRGAVNNGRYNTEVAVEVDVMGGTLRRFVCNGTEIQGNRIDIDTDGTYLLMAETVNDQDYRLVESIRFVIDKTPPIADAGPDRIFIEGEKVVLVGSGRDINEIINYRWMFSNEQQEYYGKTLTLDSLLPGDYQISLWVKDAFGNWSSQPDTAIIRIVCRPAQVRVTGVKQYEHTNRPVTIHVTADHGTIQSLQLNGKAFQSGNTVSEEGRYVLEVIAANQAQDTMRQQVIFTIDKTAPLAVAGGDRHCFDDGEPLTFDGRTSIDSISLAKFEWTFSDGEKLSGPVVHKGFHEPGVYTVSLIVTDMAGNASSPDIRIISVMDKGNTRIIMTGLEDKGNYNRDVDFHVDVIEGTLQSITVNKNIYYATDVMLTSDGLHRIEVKAVNEQGYTLTKRWTIMIDKTPPIPDAGGNRRAFINQPIRFSGGFSHDNSGIGEYRWEFSDGQILTGRDVERTFSESGDIQVSLWVKDSFGNWSLQPSQVFVSVLDPGMLATVTVKIMDEQNRILPNTIVVFENTKGVQTKTTTDSFGEIKELMEAGSYNIFAYYHGYKSAIREISIDQSEQITETISLVKGSDIITTVESRQLDLNEIRALGIDTSLPENRFIFKFQLYLEYMEAPIEFLSNAAKNIKIDYEDGKDYKGTIEGEASFPEPRIMSILIKGTASVLKEFHELSIILINGADESVSLDNTELYLNLPQGLSLAPIPEANQTFSGDSILKQSLFVQAGDIVGQSQKKISWVLRGDEPGTYAPTIDYSGTLNPFAIKIKDSARLESPIQVSDPSLLQLRAAFPDIVYANEPFTVTLELKNQSSKPFYDAYLQVDSIKVKYARLLSNLNELFVRKDCLMPGEKITLAINFLPSFTGILSALELEQIGGNARFNMKILPDCPRLFTQIETDDGKVLLEWLANPGSLTYFAVRRRKAGEQEFKVICSECYDNFYIDTQVENFVLYEYVISAIDLDGEESEFSKVVSAMPGKITTNLPEGFYSEPITVILDAGNPNSIIYYTTDGSDPIIGCSEEYNGSIAVNRSTVIKAMAATGDSISRIFEYCYYIENTISGDFVNGAWEKVGDNQAIHTNTGNEYQLNLNDSTTYDWGAAYLPPSYLRTMPTGNWIVESLVALECFKDGTGFSIGLLLTNDVDSLAWGFYKGTNLMISSPEGTSGRIISNGSTHIYLRLRKVDEQIFFEYRVNNNEPWQLAETRNLSGSIKVGVYARTWSKPNQLVGKFVRFSVNLIPSLEPVWLWRCPVSGPNYQIVSGQAVTITVPNTRTYNQGKSSDYAPKLYRQDIGNEDWRFSAAISLDERTDLSTFFTGLFVHFGDNDWLYWGREGNGLTAGRTTGKTLFSLPEAPTGLFELQIQRTGDCYTFLYRRLGEPSWIKVGSVDITLQAKGLGLGERTWNQPQRIVTTFSRMSLEKMLPKLSQEWSWLQGSSGVNYRVLGSDGVAIHVSSSNYFDDSDVNHRVSRLQREAGRSDWHLEAFMMPKNGGDGRSLAGLQVSFMEKDIVTWGINSSGALELERSGELIQTFTGIYGPVYLRIRRIGNQYSFDYRQNGIDPWIEAAKLNISINPRQAAVAVKTYAPTDMEVQFEGLRFERVLPGLWEWYAPQTGPNYEVQADNTIRIKVPNDKSYPNSATLDKAPQVHTDLALRGMNGDWTMTSEVTLEEYASGTKFTSGIMVDFGSNKILQWGFYNGLNLRGVWNGKTFTKLLVAEKTMQLQIRKVGNVYYLEHRHNSNELWQTAGSQVVDSNPVKAGIMSSTSASCRISTVFSMPEFIRIIPEYQIIFNLSNARWKTKVSNATIRVNQRAQRPINESYSVLLPEGLHEVVITAPGYKTYRQQMEVLGPKIVDVYLEPEADASTVVIQQVLPNVDPITGQIGVGFHFTNTGTDVKLWVRISLIDVQNKTVAVLGREFFASTGQELKTNTEEFIFKLSANLLYIKTEVLEGAENGSVLAVGETPIV